MPAERPNSPPNTMPVPIPLGDMNCALDLPVVRRPALVEQHNQLLYSRDRHFDAIPQLARVD